MQDKAAEYWDQRPQVLQPLRTRWWQFRTIHRHINQIVCGKPIDGVSAGFHELIRVNAQRGGFARAISIGSGNGVKEAQLLESGLVERFDLFEISGIRRREGEALAERKGWSQRMRYLDAESFTDIRESYDLVYWNNALHHMEDARQALRWSWDRLAAAGTFAMDDYVGASRFQWTDASINFASRFREGLEPELLKSPHGGDRRIPTRIARPNLQKMIETDPSEAADSDNILPAVSESFPDAKIIFTGGVIYHLGLNDVLANIDEVAHLSLLRTALLLDHAVSQLGENQYAVAVASK